MSKAVGVCKPRMNTPGALQMPNDGVLCLSVENSESPRFQTIFLMNKH